MESIKDELPNALNEVQQAKMLYEAESIVLAKTALQHWLTTLSVQQLRGLYKMCQSDAVAPYVSIEGKERSK